jgi:zinc protease
MTSANGFRIPIERYSLENGMRVVLSPDNAVPVVSVYVIYSVGARSEVQGRSGFAHLFEHMMFQGSQNAPKGLHFKLVESNGGELNGSTHPDFTDYFESLPSNQLAVGLWLEADRMRALAITEENLQNQKDAVKEERRMRFDNQPYVVAMAERWFELVYKNWSNAHSIIGSFQDLDASTTADVEAFFRTYYAPNNAVLVIAGDFQPEEAKRLVAGYFSDIPPQPQPARPDLSEEEQTEPRRLVVPDPLAKVPGVIMGWHGPQRRSNDYYSLVMLDEVLTEGDSSRFHLNLIKGRQSVVQYEAGLGWPYASYADYRDPNLYGMFFLHHPNYTGNQIVEQVTEELDKIKQSGPEPNELDRIRTLFRSLRLNRMQRAMSRARMLGLYELLDNHPEHVNTELNRFLSVSAEEIRDVAVRYLRPERLSVLEIVPAPSNTGQEEE